MKVALGAILCFCLFAGSLSTQSLDTTNSIDPVPIGNAAPAPGAAGSVSDDGSAFTGYGFLMTRFEFVLSMALLIFGGIVAFFQFLLAKQFQASGRDAQAALLTTLIVIGTLLIITAGIHGQIMTSAMGLFGTITGYLLGRSDRRTPPESRSLRSNGRNNDE